MDNKLKRLLRDLFNPDDDLRALAAMTIMKHDFPDKITRETVLKELVAATGDQNVSVRFFTRKAIDKIKKTEQMLNAQIGAEAPKLDIGKALASEDYEERLNAVMTIKSNNLSEYKDKLISMLNTELHNFVRATLISALKMFLDKSQADILSRFLNDSDSRVRSNTIEALEYLRAEESIPSLFTALNDNDNRIRAAAAKALQSFGEEKVFAELKKMLESSEEWMKSSAIYALSHIQSGEAIKLLIGAAKTSLHAETRIKAINALANYHDLTSWGFLKAMASSENAEFKATAQKALKTVNEKFGGKEPTTTMVADEAPNAASEAGDRTVSNFAGAVTNFFKQSKQEVVGLSNKAAIHFAESSINKQIDELLKEAGHVVFDIYQSGQIELYDILSIGHEILRMNFFIKKYEEQSEAAKANSKPTGFFEQLKRFFSLSSSPQKKSASQCDHFIKRREELMLRMGTLAIEKYEKKEFQPKQLEQYYNSYKALQKQLSKP